MKRLLYSLLLLAYAISACGIEKIDINRGWRFKKGVELRTMSDGDAVDLPHSWNIADAMFGGDYFRGTATYSRMLKIPDLGHEKRFFLRIGAAQSEADVYIDNRWIGNHRGGYTAFAIELTPYVTPGREHKLDIRINNSQTSRTAPLSGDFNIFGGLTRGAELLITEPTCIAPDFYGSPGVFFRQDSVSDEKAVITVQTIVSAPDETERLEVAVTLSDNGRIVCTDTLPTGAGNVAESVITVKRPHLWDGVHDPFLYDGVVSLIKDGKVVDSRTEKIGLRYYKADNESGFFLNGKSYRLNGVNLHQDRAERGPAYLDGDHREDLDLAREMGCNAVRLAHYPHGRQVYDIADEYGMVAWTEIPFVNIYVANPEYAANLRRQLREMIYQNFNHPSVLTWGLFNEVNSGWMEPVDAMVAELHTLAREIDPSRPTTGASNQDDIFNDYPDYIAFNKYFGWYGDSPEEMGIWIDRQHSTYPHRMMGISEYGAGGNTAQQCEELVHPEPWEQWHPENWQTHYHIENWRQLKARPFLWCNFIWCLCDFSSAGRKEGNTPGRNDKGLVAYDRSTRKDAFYFYKANWNEKDPVLYIAGHRNDKVSTPAVDIMAFSNVGAATLTVNGKNVGKATPDEVNVIIWRDVPLQSGDNDIVVTAGKHTARCTKHFNKQ